MSVDPEEPVIRKSVVAGIDNFSRFDGLQTFAGKTVGFGGATKPEAAAWLSSEGFSALICLRQASEEGVDVEASRRAAREAGLEYIHLPFSPADSDQSVIAQFLARAGETANQPLYIHCGSATRVAALWMIGRVRKDNIELQQAEWEVRQISDNPDNAIAVASAWLRN